MITRPCAKGHLTIIDDATGPVVAEWGITEVESAANAGAAHMRMMEREEDARAAKEQEQARLAAEFAKQAVAEFLKIRARA